MTPEHEVWCLCYFLTTPFIWFCLQYGWDLIMDDVVPMSKRQIERRL
jgi:hypothetical protein